MPLTLRAAIVGAGRMGGTIDDEVATYPAIILPYSHAATYAAVEGVALVALADPIPEKRASFGQRWAVPPERQYADYREMVERERPDILSITTPATGHAEITIFAADHGVRGIWCEKAMACSLAECDAMVAAVERNGTKFNIGTSRRYHPGVARLREMIEGGELGELRAVLTYGGGPLLHTGSHYWDLLLRLAGDVPVEWVQGWTDAGDAWDGESNHVPRDLPGSGQCRFANGVMGYYIAGGLPGEYEAIGSEASVRVRNNGVDWELWKHGSRPDWEHRKSALSPFNRQDFPHFKRISPSVRLLQNLRDAVVNGGQTLGNAQVACAGTELALGVVESHRQGGARVPCPIENRALYMVSK